MTVWTPLRSAFRCALPEFRFGERLDDAGSDFLVAPHRFGKCFVRSRMRGCTTQQLGCQLESGAFRQLQGHFLDFSGATHGENMGGKVEGRKGQVAGEEGVGGWKISD